MTNIAVTGATGNLGGLVVDHLLSLGIPPADIVPFVRSAEKADAFTAREMKPRIASSDDPASFGGLFPQSDRHRQMPHHWQRHRTSFRSFGPATWRRRRLRQE